jgi:hypothetical protein
MMDHRRQQRQLSLLLLLLRAMCPNKCCSAEAEVAVAAATSPSRVVVAAVAPPPQLLLSGCGMQAGSQVRLYVRPGPGLCLRPSASGRLRLFSPKRRGLVDRETVSTQPDRRQIHPWRLQPATDASTEAGGSPRAVTGRPWGRGCSQEKWPKCTHELYG